MLTTAGPVCANEPMRGLQISPSSNMIGLNKYESKEVNRPVSPRFEVIYHLTLDPFSDQWILIKVDFWRQHSYTHHAIQRCTRTCDAHRKWTL